MTKLRPHQERFLKEDPDKALLCWEMRTGKSLPASLWGERRKRNCIVVCPKQLVKDWKKLSPYATIYSKEQFKKAAENKEISNPSALIIDEAHAFGSAVFTRKRSLLSFYMYEFIRKNPSMDVLLLTATPIRNDPSSLHTLLCFIGVMIPWKEWRAEFYDLKMMPYLKFPAYFPKEDWRIRIRQYLEKHADIVSLKDCVKYLPPVTKIIEKIRTPKFVRDLEKEYRWTDIHQHEQTAKLPFIKSLGYRKVIVVCHYTAQIDSLKRELEKEREVFVLDGRTKDADKVKRQAQESEECYFIVQASMGFGFDGFMFGAIVFASMSHTALDHTQMTGRMTNVDNPQPVFLYYLIGGKWDQRIYDSIMLNQDFNPHIYKNEEIA